MKGKYDLGKFSNSTWSLIIFNKDKIIFRSRMRRLKPLIFAIKRFGKDLRGAEVYDRNVGQASAMLLKYAGVKKIYTPTMSEAGEKFLKKNNIPFEYIKKVKFIAKADCDDLCPMEKMCEELGEEAFVKKMLGQ